MGHSGSKTEKPRTPAELPFQQREISTENRQESAEGLFNQTVRVHLGSKRHLEKDLEEVVELVTGQLEGTSSRGLAVYRHRTEYVRCLL